MSADSRPATPAKPAKPGASAPATPPVTLVAASGELLIGAVPIEDGRITSRRILKAPGARIVRLALDKDQVMREHTAAVPVLITVLSGSVFVDADGRTTELPTGAILYLAAHLPHSVEAIEAAQLTLTLLDGYDAITLGTGASGAASANSGSAAGSSSAPKKQPKQPEPLAQKPTLASHLVLASSGADAAALDAITQRHAEISGALAAHSTHLLEAAASAEEQPLADARDRLAAWSRTVLTPQLSAEAGVLYPAAEDTSAGAELVTTLRDELATIGDLLENVMTEDDASQLAASSVSLRVTVARHLRAETERLLPLLASSPQHSLASLWATIEGTVKNSAEGSDGASAPQTADPDVAGFVPANPAASESAHPEPAQSAAATCACGVVDEPAFPELDVREVPHAIRHATVFGALDSLTFGGGLVLVAPHDPLPLLAQIEQRAPSRFAVSYLQRGPESWRLQLVHTGAATPAS